MGANITDWPGAGQLRHEHLPRQLEQLAALTDPPPRKPAPHVVTHVTAGRLSLAALATQHGTTPMHVLHLTCAHFGGFPSEVAAWGNAVLRGDADPMAPMPAGMHLRVPVTG